MDAALIFLAGDGEKRFSKPAVELQISEDVGKLKLSSFTRLVSDDWDSQRFEAVYKVTDKLEGSIQYYTGTEGHGPDTVQLVSKYKIGNSPFKVTASYSPDAFGAGKRYRVGGQVYIRKGDVSAWAWVTARYFDRLDNVNYESWYTLNYHLSEDTTLTIKRFDSDFFGDNVTAEIKFNF